MKSLAVLTALTLATPIARADSLWCGTFRLEQPAATSTWVVAPPRAPLHIDVVKGDHLRAPAMLALAVQLDIAPCGLPGGHAFRAELVVATTGAVIAASAAGVGAAERCVAARLRSVRFPRAAAVRRVSARIATP